MRSLVHLITTPLRVWTRWYLRKPRAFTYGSLDIVVLPGAFHPGFFHSTKMILNYLSQVELEGLHFLELGSGTGIISVSAALSGAKVTAIDISETAIRNTMLNQEKNSVTLNIIQSDLFDKVPTTRFDWIVINPPYYPSKPVTDKDYAWYCGVNHEYFRKLFQQLKNFIHHKSQVLMVLSEVCELATILEIASDNGFELKKIAEKKIWVDGRNYLFLIDLKV